VGLWQTTENYRLKNIIELDNTLASSRKDSGRGGGSDFKEREDGSAWAERWARGKASLREAFFFAWLQKNEKLSSLTL
jgi:hypothetical protein